MTSRVLEFRPLHTELRSGSSQAIAAFHDLRRLHYVDEASSDRLVVLHENVHDDLLRHTVFGAFQGVLAYLRDRMATPQAKSYLDTWLTVSIDSSRISHESAATYLSVKQLPPAQGLRAFTRLPDEYRSYYAVFADALEGVFQATYIQFIIAKVIVEVAMASRIDDLLQLAEQQAPAHIPPRSQPDHRLGSLLSLARPHFRELLEAIQVEIASSGATTGTRIDIQSESAWGRLTIEGAEGLEETVFGVARGWLYRWGAEAGHIVLPLQVPEYADLIATTLGRAMSFDMGGSPLAPPDRSSQASAVRINSLAHLIDTKSAPRLAEDNPQDMQMALAATLYVSPDPDCREEPSEWVVARPAGDGRYSVARMGSRMFWSVLAVRRQLISLGMPLPALPTILTGFTSEHGEQFAAFHNRLVQAHSLGQGSYGLDKLLWYWSGDLMWWISTLSRGSSLQIMPYVVDTTADVARSLEAADAMSLGAWGAATEHLNFGPGWYVFRSPRLAGSAIRVLPVHGDFGDHVSRLLQQGILQPVPEEQRQLLGDRVGDVFRTVIPTFWSTL